MGIVIRKHNQNHVKISQITKLRIDKDIFGILQKHEDPKRHEEVERQLQTTED